MFPYGLYHERRAASSKENTSLSQVHKDAWYSALIGALTSVAMQAPAELGDLAKTQRGREQLAHELADQVGRQVTQQTEGPAAWGPVAQSGKKGYTILEQNTRKEILNGDFQRERGENATGTAGA